MRTYQFKSAVIRHHIKKVEATHSFTTKKQAVKIRNELIKNGCVCTEIERKD